MKWSKALSKSQWLTLIRLALVGTGLLLVVFGWHFRDNRSNLISPDNGAGFLELLPENRVSSIFTAERDGLFEVGLFFKKDPKIDPAGQVAISLFAVPSGSTWPDNRDQAVPLVSATFPAESIARKHEKIIRFPNQQSSTGKTYALEIIANTQSPKTGLHLICGREGACFTNGQSFSGGILVRSEYRDIFPTVLLVCIFIAGGIWLFALFGFPKAVKEDQDRGSPQPTFRSDLGGLVSLKGLPSWILFVLGGILSLSLFFQLSLLGGGGLNILEGQMSKNLVRAGEQYLARWSANFPRTIKDEPLRGHFLGPGTILGVITLPIRIFPEFPTFPWSAKTQFTSFHLLLGRLLTIAVGFFGLLFSFNLIRKWTKSETTPLLLLSFLAFYEFYVYYSASFRGDVWCFTAITGLFIILLRLIEDNSLHLYLIAGIFTGISVASKQNTAVVGFAVVLLEGYKLIRGKGSFKGLLIYLGISTITVIVLFPPIIYRPLEVIQMHIRLAEVSSAYHQRTSQGSFLIGLINVRNRFDHLIWPIPKSIFAASLIISAVLLFIKRRIDLGLSLLIGLLIVLPTAITTFLDYHYFLPVIGCFLPLPLVLAGNAIHHFVGKVWLKRSMDAVLSVGAVILAGVMISHLLPILHHDTRQAALQLSYRVMLEQARPGQSYSRTRVRPEGVEPIDFDRKLVSDIIFDFIPVEEHPDWIQLQGIKKTMDDYLVEKGLTPPLYTKVIEYFDGPGRRVYLLKKTG